MHCIASKAQFHMPSSVNISAFAQLKMPSSKPSASSHEHSPKSIVVLHKYCSICIAPLCIAQLCIAILHIAPLCIVSNQLLHFIWMAPIPFHCSISIGPNVWLQANCCIAYAEHLCYGSIIRKNTLSFCTITRQLQIHAAIWYDSIHISKICKYN